MPNLTDISITATHLSRATQALDTFDSNRAIVGQYSPLDPASIEGQQRARLAADLDAARAAHAAAKAAP